MSPFFKIFAAFCISLGILMPVTCGAVALPGQPLLTEDSPSTSRSSFGLPGETSGNGKNLLSLNKLIKRGLQIISAISVVVLIWTGILYLISYGDEEKTKRAKKSILWTLLGLVTGLGGWAIIDIINSISLIKP